MSAASPRKKKLTKRVVTVALAAVAVASIGAIELFFGGVAHASEIIWSYAGNR